MRDEHEICVQIIISFNKNRFEFAAKNKFEFAAKVNFP